MRPRLADPTAEAATDSEGQLSIFEVDPATISTDAVALGAESGRVPLPSGTGPDWSGIRLDKQPVDVPSRPREGRSGYGRAAGLAPRRSRLMAAAVDWRS